MLSVSHLAGDSRTNGSQPKKNRSQRDVSKLLPPQSSTPSTLNGVDHPPPIPPPLIPPPNEPPLGDSTLPPIQATDQRSSISRGAVMLVCASVIASLVGGGYLARQWPAQSELLELAQFPLTNVDIREGSNNSEPTATEPTATEPASRPEPALTPLLPAVATSVIAELDEPQPAASATQTQADHWPQLVRSPRVARSIGSGLRQSAQQLHAALSKVVASASNRGAELLPVATKPVDNFVDLARETQVAEATPASAPPSGDAKVCNAAVGKEAVCALKPPTVEPTSHGTLGTAIHWEPSVMQAAAKAGKQNKLLFVIHVSGNFENPGFT